MDRHRPFAAQCWCSECFNPVIHYDPLTERLECSRRPPSIPDSDSEVICLNLPNRPWFNHPPTDPAIPPTPILAFAKMNIAHPRRVLAVSLPGDGLASFIKGLTNVTPSETEDTIAGTTHYLSISTPYYKAEVPIWLDEVTDSKVWCSEFLTPAAREVINAVGAFVVCFRKPIDDAGLKTVRALLEDVAEVVKKGCGTHWDGLCLAVGMPQSITPYLEKSFDDWEELCQRSGFEYVDYASKGRNEFSEPTGLERLVEALESNDWYGGDESGDVKPDDFDEDDEEAEDSVGFGIGAEEMGLEMDGMKRAIYEGGLGLEDDQNEDDQDEEVEKLQAMMLKMQAARDMGADLPEPERKRLAAKAVDEIMKTL